MAEIRRIWDDARQNGNLKRPAWPMIVFRTPKGWTCPPEIDGKKCEGYWRSHQVPMGDMDKPEHVRILPTGGAPLSAAIQLIENLGYHAILHLDRDQDDGGSFGRGWFGYDNPPPPSRRQSRGPSYYYQPGWRSY